MPMKSAEFSRRWCARKFNCSR